MVSTLHLARQLLGFNTINPPGSEADCMRFFANWLDESGFEVTGCARLLRVSRASVYRRIQDSPQYRLASQVPLDELNDVLGDYAGDSVRAAHQLRVSHAGLQVVLRNSHLEWY